MTSETKSGTVLFVRCIVNKLHFILQKNTVHNKVRVHAHTHTHTHIYIHRYTVYTIILASGYKASHLHIKLEVNNIGI